MPFLKALDKSTLDVKPSPNKWSFKEIMGHLIDSAGNNHQKFVRMQQQAHLDFVGYAQNHWVATAHYNAMEWEFLLDFWKNYNFFLAHLIENVHPSTLQNRITIDTEGFFELEFIMKDYIEHLKHHLRQVLPTVAIESRFVNVYHT